MSKTLCFVLAVGVAAPALAQKEMLIGTWEHFETDEDSVQLVMRVEFKADGQFALNFRSAFSAEEFMGEGEGEGEGEEPADVGAELSAQILAALLPDTLAISVTATGTWEADDKSLRLDAMTSELKVNDLGVQEFLTQLGKELARRMAEAFAVSEADYPAFEQQILQEFYSGAGAGFSEGFAADDLDLVGTYAFQEEVLSITDAEGEVTEWRRVVGSAVASTTWGEIKALDLSALRR